MKTLLPHLGRKGLIFNHETMLWTWYDTNRRVAVALRYLNFCEHEEESYTWDALTDHPYAGSSTKINVPCHNARTS
jgi:hypothetical protein